MSLLGRVRAETDATLPPLACWPLPGARLVGRLPASARNINLLVEDSAGSRYVLRGCKRNPHRERIVFQLEFQDQLRRRGIPVPQVVASQAGELVVATSPSSLWVMSDFVAGHHYRYDSSAQLLHAARCLSAIHAAGAGFSSRAGPRRHDPGPAAMVDSWRAGDRWPARDVRRGGRRTRTGIP